MPPQITDQMILAAFRQILEDRVALRLPGRPKPTLNIAGCSPRRQPTCGKTISCKSTS